MEEQEWLRKQGLATQKEVEEIRAERELKLKGGKNRKDKNRKEVKNDRRSGDAII